MKLTKAEALDKIEELKKYVENEEKNEASSKVKLQIKTFGGEVLLESKKTTIKDALVEAASEGADLRGSYLTGAKFYGKGGTTKIKRDQVDDFFKALGVVVEN